MVGLVYLFFKMMWWMLVVSLWLCWAMFAVTIALVCALCGNKSGARSLMRSLAWSVFRL